jgi:hypothetical protein
MKMLSVLVAAILPLFIVACATSTPAPVIDFGDDDDDSGNGYRWVRNGTCDDPRFSGPGRGYDESPKATAYHDASDCRALYQRGRIQLRNTQRAVSIAGMDFGDDYSHWARNGECDDPRFSGPGVARKLSQEDRFRDAVDCSNLYQSGRIQLAPGEVGPRRDARTRIRIDGIDFGNDTHGEFNDKCDDPRFSGPGRGISQNVYGRFRDATDCSVLYQRGLLRLKQDPSTMTPQPLQYGATQQGHLPENDYADYYHYQGSAGTLVMLDLISPDFYPYLTVTSPSGERWSNEEYGGDLNHSRVMLRLPEAGEYQVEAAILFNTEQGGAYTLTLNSLAVIADNPYAGSLQSDDDLLDTGEYADTWTFTGKRGEFVTISLSSDDFYTYLVLLAPDGQIVRNSEAIGDCNICGEPPAIASYYNSRIEHELAAAGTYTVRVTSSTAGETGAYLLRIIRSEVSH